MAYEKLGFVDGVTPLDAEHFNHMEEGIEKANSIIETVGGDTLTWDGDVTGKQIVDIDGAYLVRVSDVIPAFDDFANGGSFTVMASGSLEQHTFTSAEILEMDGGYCHQTMAFFVMTEDNVDAEGIVFPTKGVYFYYVLPENDDYYVSSLTIHGYTGFTQEKLKPEALPEGVKVKPTWDDIGASYGVYCDEHDVEVSEEGTSILLASEPKVGDQMNVVMDGESYACAVYFYPDIGASVIGNVGYIGAGTDTGEPFLGLVIEQVMILFVRDATVAHSIKISGPLRNKIPDDYVSHVKTFYIDQSSGIYLYHDIAETEKVTQEEFIALSKK